MTSTQIEGVDPDDSIRDIMRKTHGPDRVGAWRGTSTRPRFWVVDWTRRGREIVAGGDPRPAHILLRSRYLTTGPTASWGTSPDARGSRRARKSSFFDAASHVTRAMAVGMADVFEIYPATG